MTTTEYGRPIKLDPVQALEIANDKAMVKEQRQRERREKLRQVHPSSSSAASINAEYFYFHNKSPLLSY